MSAPDKIAIIGAGAWGTALALCAARAGRNLVLWGNVAADMQDMARKRINVSYLPGINLPALIQPTADAALLKTAVTVIVAVPAQQLVSCLEGLKKNLTPKVTLILAAKGIDGGSGAFLSDKIKTLLPGATIGALSGPSFAQDVAKGLPTAVTLALADQELGARIAAALSSQTFRLYLNADVRGVEIGGALKNILAIAAGIVVGRKLGDSAQAALIARGFAEMQRFGAAYGAKPETFGGLSGLGDLVLTATSLQSRNLRFGIALGEGESVQSANERLGTVEGIATSVAACKLAQAANVDIPITSAVAGIVEGRATIDKIIEQLMNRPLKAE